MPNVKNMQTRLLSHMARVSGKAIQKEDDRIARLLSSQKISPETAQFMRVSSAIRLAYIANAA